METEDMGAPCIFSFSPEVHADVSVEQRNVHDVGRGPWSDSDAQLDDGVQRVDHGEQEAALPGGGLGRQSDGEVGGQFLRQHHPERRLDVGAGAHAVGRESVVALVEELRPRVDERDLDRLQQLVLLRDEAHT